MVTAAGVAMANRLPVLMLSGDTFQSRLPDPVLQQVEHFGAPSTTANDAFRAVVRYWDRITRPEQVLRVVAAGGVDDARPGGLRAGVHRPAPGRAGRGVRLPDRVLRAETVHTIARPRPDRGQVADAVDVLRAAERPLMVVGGGVHYSLAEAEVAAFAERHGIPIVETVAGKSTVAADHPCYAGPIGVIGAEGANRLAAEADVVVAVGTRLQDFTTGSWTVFRNDALRIIGVNVARFDAGKHRAVAVVGRRPRDDRRARRGPRRVAGAGGVDGAGAPEVATLWEYLDRIGAPQPDGAVDLRPGRRPPSTPRPAGTTTR